MLHGNLAEKFVLTPPLRWNIGTQAQAHEAMANATEPPITHRGRKPGVYVHCRQCQARVPGEPLSLWPSSGLEVVERGTGKERKGLQEDVACDRELQTTGMRSSSCQDEM
jgi:hypothetical protein